jgi:membrane protein
MPGSANLARPLTALYRRGRDTFDAYGRHDGSLLAAAIAYRVLFSVVPFVALLLSVLDLVLPDEPRDRFSDWLFGVFPGQDVEESVSRELASSGAQAPLVGVIALVLLLWGASGMMASVRKSFRILWDADARPNYVRGKLRDIAFVALAGALIIGAFALSVVAQVAVDAGAHLSDAIGLSAPLSAIVGFAQIASTATATFVALVALYRLVPPVRPQLRDVWLPAALTALAFQVAVAAFSVYVAEWADYSTVYGPIGAVLAFLLLVYILASMLLLGAELVAHDAIRRRDAALAAVQDEQAEGRRPGRQEGSGNGNEEGHPAE